MIVFKRSMYGRTGDKHPNSKVTDRERFEMVDLYRYGWTLQEIADVYCLSIPQVGNIIKAAHAVNPNRKPQKRLSDPEKTEIRQLYATGNYTQEQLAAIFDVDQKTICNVIKKGTLTSPSPHN